MLRLPNVVARPYRAQPLPASSPSPERRKSVLVAVHFPRTPDHEFNASLDELERLVTTLGYRVVTRVTQLRAHVEHTAVVGEGKLKELAEITGGKGDIAPTIPRRKDKARR